MNSKISVSEIDFIKNFRSEITVASPGRINLIGEHTDYNNGFVLPTAIDLKVNFQFQKNNFDNKCRIYSKTFEALAEFSLNDISRSKNPWENYLLGVIKEIEAKGKKIEGFDCIIESELPIGAGISSSAALECGFAAGLNELFNFGFSKSEIVQIGQNSENNFVGSNCGIMDQFASVMSKKNHLILLDCNSLNAEYIPADFQNCKILLLNTNVSHNIAESEYNTRRRECEEAVKIIKQKYPEVNSLRDVNFEILAEHKAKMPQINYQRSFFVLKENERVLKAAEAMKNGSLEEFGALMYESHEGLQHDYDVSCQELDFLVEFSKNKKYIYGSRMMGGGFGGCTINIIEEYKIAEYIKEASEAYQGKYNIQLDAIVVSPSEGTVVSAKL